MIQIKVDANRFSRTINSIMKEVQDIPSVRNTSYLSRAAASIAANKFIKDLNAMARTDPRKYHHLYEWSESGTQAGSNSARLFKLVRSTEENVSYLNIKLMSSKRRAPIADILKQPGPSGKVVKRSGVFKNKAEVMENGSPIGFIAQRTIAFPSRTKDKIIFRRKGSVISIKNPGGRATTGSLARYAKKWERENLSSAVRKSNLFDDLDKAITRATNKKQFNSNDIHEAVKKVSNKYNQSQREY